MNGLCLTSITFYQASIQCRDSKYQQKNTEESVKRPSINVIQTQETIQLN